jgi:hypothetical protein
VVGLDAQVLSVQDLMRKFGSQSKTQSEENEKPSPDSPEGRRITKEFKKLFGVKLSSQNKGKNRKDPDR